MPNTTPMTLTGLTRIFEHLLKYRKVYLIILLLIVLLIPYSVRYLGGNPTIIGASSYFHLNAAEHNPYQNPYHLLLSLNFINNQFIYQLAPIILAILSLFLLINIAGEFKINPINQFFFLLFLVISPAFIYTFTVLTHHSFFIFLNLLGFTLLLKKKKLLNYLSFPIFAIIPFFDVFSSILTLLFLAVYFYVKKDKQGNSVNNQINNQVNSRVKILTIIITILTFLNIFLKKLFLLGPYNSQNVFADLFSDLGGLFGLSIFALLLAVTGLIITWKKEKFFLAYLFLPFLILLFIYQTSTLIYLNFFIAFFASFGFTYFFNKEWKINIIKNIFLFLLILGLVFSTVTSLSKLSALPPSLETKESISWLKENTRTYKLIFSHPQDSYLVEYFSGRPAFIHYHDPDFKTRSDITDRIFQSTYIKETFPLLEQNDISHIYLSPKIKADLPPDRGLIFLFQNERFKKIYSRKDIEIRKFKNE